MFKYLVSYEYYPEKSGGLARHSFDIFSRSLEKDNYIGLVATGNNANRSTINIKYIYIKTFNYGLIGYLEFAFKLYLRYIRNNDKDTFIFFSIFSYLVPLRVFFPKKMYIFVHNTLKRVYTTDYNDEGTLERILRKIQYFFLYKLEAKLVNYARKVFVVSESTFRDSENHYSLDKSKIILIKNGIDLKDYSIGLPKIVNNKNLLFVGRLTVRKNVGDLIEIMNILVKDDPNYKLTIVGTGSKEYQGYLTNKIEKYGLQNYIDIKNNINLKELNEYYLNSSIFIFSSLVEGFGLVLLEAMTKGLPIISYDIVGVKDVVEDGKDGFLVDIGNFELFVDKIKELENNTKYKMLSRNAIEKVNQFNWDESVNLFHEILENDYS